MSKHTPGPWFITNPHSMGTFYIESRIRPGILQEVASCGPTENNDHREANARLIAAAPDLLAALQAVLDSLGALTKRHELLNYMSEQEADSVFAAIAKALGETS